MRLRMVSTVLVLAAASTLLAAGGSAAPPTCGSNHRPPCQPAPDTKMGRLVTIGGETNDATQEGVTLNGATFSTTNPRTGTYAYRQTTANVSVASFTGALSTVYYARIYCYVSALPASALTLLSFRAGGLAALHITLNPDGSLELDRTAGIIGSPTAAGAMAAGSYTMLELAIMTDATVNDYAEARLNGVSFASSSTVSISNSAPDGFQFARSDGTITTDTDDIALNDNSGASQNTWPGSGKVVLLKPISDNAGGLGWTLGTGTALGGNGFTAVDNLPPTGVADLTAGSDPKQIRNASANANTNYDANMTSYATAGITAADTVNVIVPFVSTSAPVVTSAKLGTVGVVSNPAIANVALGAGGTPGAFWSGVAGAAYPTGWKKSLGTTTYAPSVTVATSPVMRITQVTSSTRIAVVDFLGMYVDYTPAVVVSNIAGLFDRMTPRRRSLQRM